MYNSPTHSPPPQGLLFHLRENASLKDPFIYYSLLNSSAKHTLHETTTVWCLTKMKLCHELISLSRFRISFYGLCGVWKVAFTRLHKHLSVEGLQNCFLLENFVNYTEAYVVLILQTRTRSLYGNLQRRSSYTSKYIFKLSESLTT